MELIKQKHFWIQKFLIVLKIKMNKVDLQELIKTGKITSKTLERVSIAKNYIEKKYEMKKK